MIDVKLFKSKGNRKTTGGKRTTPFVPHRLSPAARTFLARAFLVAIAISAGCTAYLLFKKHYLLKPAVFNLGNIRKNVTFDTGKTIRPDMICEWLGLKNGTASFDIDIEQSRNKITALPNVKEVEITRTMPDRLDIRIKEREPLARLSAGPRGLVADEEGVAFVQHSTDNILPLVRVSAEFDQIKPSDRLAGMELKAMRVLQQASRAGFKLRISEIDTRHSDYLMIIFSDYRKAKFAWNGMKDERMAVAQSDDQLRRQLDELAKAMESEIGRPRQMWDATIPGRITAKSITN